MEKQTKNVITREWVEKELRFYNTADIKSTLTLCGALSLLFVPLTALLIFGTVSLFENVWLKVLLSVLVGIIMSAPVWINLLSLRLSLEERKLLLSGDFDIITCEVLYKSEKTSQRHSDYLLHFEGFGDTSVTRTQYELASSGDEFYIVYYKAQNKVKQLYSAKMYEF